MTTAYARRGVPVLYSSRISLIMLSLPSTSVATSSFVFLDIVSVEVGGIAFCLEKASMSDLEIDDVIGMRIEIWI